MSYAGNLNKGEIITGGITGIAENSKLLNVGNEGAESNGSKVLMLLASGVMCASYCSNAYNKGKIYGILIKCRALYSRTGRRNSHS